MKELQLDRLGHILCETGSAAHRIERCRHACPVLEAERTLGDEHLKAVHSRDASIARDREQRCGLVSVDQVDDIRMSVVSAQSTQVAI